MKVKAHCPFLGHTGYNAHTRGFFTALSKVVDLRVDNYTWCDDRHNYLTDRQKNIISAKKLLINNIFPERVLITGSLYLIGKIRKLII